MPTLNVLQDVVFCLSGYVNPQRKALREDGLALGALYRPDWSSECTHLICAFGNTPKIEAAKRTGGIIVHGDWIVQCKAATRRVPEDCFLIEKPNGRQCGGSALLKSCAATVAPPSKSPSCVKRPRDQQNDSFEKRATLEQGIATKLPVEISAQQAAAWLEKDLLMIKTYLRNEILGCSGDAFDPNELARKGIEEALCYAEEESMRKPHLDFMQLW